MTKNISEYMKKHNLTDEDLDKLAQPYEEGDYPSIEGTVYKGFHLDAVGKRRVTVIYKADVAKKVEKIASSKGITPSEVYRNTVDFYLENQ